MEQPTSDLSGGLRVCFAALCSFADGPSRRTWAVGWIHAQDRSDVLHLAIHMLLCAFDMRNGIKFTRMPVVPGPPCLRRGCGQRCISLNELEAGIGGTSWTNVTHRGISACRVSVPSTQHIAQQRHREILPITFARCHDASVLKAQTACVVDTTRSIQTRYSPGVAVALFSGFTCAE